MKNICLHIQQMHICFMHLQELWVYLAEEKQFTDFNNTEKLIWHEKELKYGNWTDGPLMDGTRLFSTTIQASEVKDISQ